MPGRWGASPNGIPSSMDAHSPAALVAQKQRGAAGLVSVRVPVGAQQSCDLEVPLPVPSRLPMTQLGDSGEACQALPAPPSPTCRRLQSAARDAWKGKQPCNMCSAALRALQPGRRAGMQGG